MADKAQLPRNTELAGKVIDAQAKERGLMGHLFGTKDHAPTNIAGFLLIACILGLALMGLQMPDLLRTHARDVVTGIFSLITLTIGYIFGRKSSDD